MRAAGWRTAFVGMLSEAALASLYRLTCQQVSVQVASVHGVVSRELADRYTALKDEMVRRGLKVQS